MNMKTSLRPPSVPLVTIDPYFSAWSAADHLYDDHIRHWTNKRCGMVGLILIDGKPKKFMGRVGLQDEPSDPAEPEVLEQTGLAVEPLTTRYTFEGEGIRLEVSFTSPLLPDDLDVLSRPVTYVTFQAKSIDGQSHQVKIYLDVTSEWCVHTTDQVVTWNRHEQSERLSALSIGTVAQPVLQRAGDDTRIDWGYMYLAYPKSERIRSAIHSAAGREAYLRTGELPAADDAAKPRPAGENMPVLAAKVDMGRIDAEPVSQFLMLAYDDVHSIEYFHQPLDAYWKRNGASFQEMLLLAADEYEDILQRCQAFSDELLGECAAAGGEQFRDIAALAYRQAIAAHKLVTDGSGRILFFSKENFSNGCIATVDVSYPSMPLFLKYNPELVKGMMRPIFDYAGSGQWAFDFAPHDVGTYPKANGQVYGENKLEYQMPIEECGNMLLMAAAVCKYEDSGDFAKENWELLSKWARYLLAHGLDPDNQLCTDDFAGHLAHNANLSIKAIVGIGAYASMCSLLGMDESAEEYLAAAKAMASEWLSMADAGDHYKLTFDSPVETWSLKYNLVWDRLLELGLFPDEVAVKEVEHYLKQQNLYGVPLDSRETYTKADWLIWSASMGTRSQFERLIAPFWDFLNETESRVPITDWYDTKSGKQMNFQNRSVVGGFFLPLLLSKRTAANRTLMKSGDQGAGV